MQNPRCILRIHLVRLCLYKQPPLVAWCAVLWSSVVCERQPAPLQPYRAPTGRTRPNRRTNPTPYTNPNHINHHSTLQPRTPAPCHCHTHTQSDTDNHPPIPYHCRLPINNLTAHQPTNRSHNTPCHVRRHQTHAQTNNLSTQSPSIRPHVSRSLPVLFPYLALSFLFSLYLLLYFTIRLLYTTIHYDTIVTDPVPTNHSNHASAHYTCRRQLLFISTPLKT